MKELATLIALALLVLASGCATGPETPDRTPESRLTEYQTVLNTFEQQSQDEPQVSQLLAEAQSLIRRAETRLSSDDSDSEKVKLHLDAAEAKLVEISTMKSLQDNLRRSEELERTYAERAEKIAELRAINEQELPTTGDNE